MSLTAAAGSITIPPSLWLTSPKASTGPPRSLSLRCNIGFPSSITYPFMCYYAPGCCRWLRRAAGTHSLLSLPKHVVCDTLPTKKWASNDALERLTNGRANRKYLTEIITERESFMKERNCSLIGVLDCLVMGLVYESRRARVPFH